MRIPAYELTHERAGKMLTVFAALRELELTRAPKTPVFGEFFDIEQTAKLMEDDPDVRRVLREASFTASDFLWTLMTTATALLVIDGLESGRLTDVPQHIGERNIQFLRNLPPDLRVAFDTWKAAEIDPALSETRRLSRGETGSSGK